MAGHSHWANISAKKGVVDKKRGKLFGKLARYIIVAARRGGGDPAANLSLRYAIDRAKKASMPNDTIERAVKKGTGELGADNYDEVLYEGYGPGGVAVLCEILTENRNRTAGEIRKAFEVHGGNLGATGCVGWMFERKGLFQVPAQNVDEDRLMEVALEAARIPTDSAELTRIAANTVDLDADSARSVLKLIEALEDNDDVQNVVANFNIPDELMAQLAES
jgi:YebC/PmpR family DNA-binding regulatory protein